MTVLNYIYVFFAMLLLFGMAVFVHEWGHMWVARKRGLKVEEFSIGFGPKLFSWTRGGILYCWRLVPAGGYVKLPQMITSEALEGSTDTENIPPPSPGSKILVAFAGPFMNVVFAFVIASVIYLVGLPIAVNPPFIGYVEPGSEEAKLGIKEGDCIVSVDGDPVKSWQDVTSFTILARTNVLPVVIEREHVQKTYYLTAKVNPSVGLKLLNLDPRDHPEIMEIRPGSAAEEASLKVGDKIIAFNGLPIAGREQLINLIHERGGKPTEMRVERANTKLELTVTPKMDPDTKEGVIGTVLGSSSIQTFIVQKPGPTPWAQVVEVVDRTYKTVSALIHSKQTGVGAKDLTGPIGILTILAAQVNTDYRLALSFLVLLNVNLAFLNLLPIPVLDGGHIVMSIIEKIQRRPLSRRFVEYATTGFAILLISFMLYVSFFDIKRFPIFRAMFQGGHQIEEPQTQTNPNLSQP
jgi:regulator of sigma E protease